MSRASRGLRRFLCRDMQPELPLLRFVFFSGVGAHVRTGIAKELKRQLRVELRNRLHQHLPLLTKQFDPIEVFILPLLASGLSKVAHNLGYESPCLGLAVTLRQEECLRLDGNAGLRQAQAPDAGQHLVDHTERGLLRGSCRLLFRLFELIGTRLIRLRECTRNRDERGKKKVRETGPLTQGFLPEITGDEFRAEIHGHRPPLPDF